MKLKEAPSLKGKKFREWYDNKVPSNGTKVNVAMAVYPEHLTDKSAFLNKVDTEEDYVKEISELINTFDEIMDENSVILLSGYWGKNGLPNEVNATWKSVMSAIKTTDYSIGDVIVWKKGSKTKGQRENSLDVICEPIFVLCRKSEYRTYHLNVEVQTTRGNASYHTPLYNIITTNGKTPEDDYKQLKEYLLRLYCPDNGNIYYMMEEAPVVQGK